jgi:glycosyltransferase involved in cell wall biosynthesis
MKTIFVANTDWYLYNFRLSLARFLRSKGFDTVFVSPPGDYADRLMEAGFKWIQWEVGRKSLAPVAEINGLRKLYSIYKSEKPDFVHHFTMKPVLYGSLAGRAAEVPGIINCVTGLGYIWLSNEPIAQSLRPFLRILFRHTLKAPNIQMIFENDGDKEYFIDAQLIDEKRTSLIPGVGVDVNKFFSSDEPEGVPVVVFPARMLRDKGLGTLIQSAENLRKQIDVRIVLVGRPDPGNPTSVDVETLQQWDKAGVIEYWGWKDDMAQVYRDSHIVVLPSLYEGVPTVLLEAAASSRPIIATDIPGIRMVVHNHQNGILVPMRDSKALSDAIKKLVIDNDLRRKMGVIGREIVLNHFTQKIINERTYDVYQKLSRDVPIP